MRGISLRERLRIWWRHNIADLAPKLDESHSATRCYPAPEVAMDARQDILHSDLPGRRSVRAAYHVSINGKRYETPDPSIPAEIKARQVAEWDKIGTLDPVEEPARP